MKHKRTIVSLLFWCFYSPFSILVWFLTNGEIGDFIGISFVGVWIVFDYLVICWMLDEFRRIRKMKARKKLENDPYLGFRALFSDSEAKK